jgi:4'-phosphopantetheinyl transferase
VKDGATDARGCELYWAPTMLLSPAHERLLSPIERKRSMGFRRRDDRTRFVLATALLRLAAGARRRRSPQRIIVDRICDRCFEPHGLPRLPGSGLHASISHADEYVAVALSDVAPVGVDIERVGRIVYTPLLDTVCTARERRHVTREADFYAYWTRKESVLKATGVGLSLPMTDVVVTPPREVPRVVSYDGRSEFAAQMVEWCFDPRYACAVTVLTDSPTPFHVHSGEGLLAGLRNLP